MKTTIAITVLACLALIPSAAADLSGKKLIQYGPEFPDTRYVREHVREMETVGFDGVVIRAAVNNAPVGDPDRWSMGYRVFWSGKLNAKDAEGPIADLQAARSKFVSESFIQCCPSMPADVDWFDPRWSDSIPHNAAIVARIAKQGGCKGLMIDPEEYGPVPLWSYTKYAPELKVKHTFREYRAKVRERGREFIRAINSEYPDITLLFLLASSFGYERTQIHGREDAKYALLMDFIDGICEAATPGTIVVDGHEQSYGYRRPSFFQRARRTILEDCRRASAVPDEFSEHVRAGFGLCMDNGPWHTDDFSKNFFTPDEFRNSLAYALDAADEYVWIWTGSGPEWWSGKNLPQEYYDALRLSKKGPKQVRERACVETAPKAAALKGYSDSETFARFYRSMTEVLDLPKEGWRFARDPEDRGVSAGWNLPAYDDSRSNWRTISIGEFWESQNECYDGDAWYRRRFTAPELPKDKPVYLAFGAVDERATVWLNGVYVGRRDVGEGGWDKPFALDVTAAIRPGDNALAVLVGDTGRLGGIWKSVKLMVRR